MPRRVLLPLLVILFLCAALLLAYAFQVRHAFDRDTAMAESELTPAFRDAARKAINLYWSGPYGTTRRSWPEEIKIQLLPRISLRQFDSLESGSTPGAAVSAFPTRGHTTAEGYLWEVRTWRNPDDSGVVLGYLRGRLWDRVQVGLK